MLTSLLIAVAKEGVPALVERLQYEPGSPLTARPTVIAKLEAGDKLLVNELCAAGITVQHRLEVTARRATEARQRELHEQEAAALREREAAVNAAHRNPRVVRSTYLDAERDGGQAAGRVSHDSVPGRRGRVAVAGAGVGFAGAVQRGRSGGRSLAILASFLRQPCTSPEVLVATRRR